MIDIEKMKETHRQEEQLAILANEIEEKCGAEPFVFDQKGTNVSFHRLKDEKEAGKVLETYKATTPILTSYTHIYTMYRCAVRFSTYDKQPWLQIYYRYKDMKFSVKIENIIDSCLYNKFIIPFGTRRVTQSEAESTPMVQKHGRLKYNSQVPLYVFKGKHTVFDGGYVESDEPTLCDEIVAELIKQYHKEDIKG